MGRDNRGPPTGGLVRKGIRSLAGGIGLASEGVKASKVSKTPSTEEHEGGPASRTNSEEVGKPDRDVDAFMGPPPSYSEVSDIDAGRRINPDQNTGNDQYSKEDQRGEPEGDLEDEWNLDDAQDEVIGEYSERDPVFDTSELEHTFIRTHSPSETINHEPRGQLPLPVVIPQRRPKDRSRGFIRAYAPVLENCGIDQAAWLAFLNAFQKSSTANPWLNAINLASIGTMFMPHVAGLIVGYAIQEATNMAIELQARQRTTNFLHKINDEFFRPRGLYCLVMTWNPESTQRVERVNLTATIASRSNPNKGLAGLPSKYRTSDGNTYGEWEFPEVAPLVFPALDQLAAQTSADGLKKKNKMAQGMTFVANYWDKRATAEYAMTNPDSVLASVPQQRFQSRYADPNNPAARGSLIAFVSGGRLVPNPESRGLVGGITNVVGQAARGERQGSGWDKLKETNSANAQQSRKGKGSRNNSGTKAGLISTPAGVYKKLLKKNVLYLMVVNMPSEEEMAAAKAAA
ncbi:MAG: hypothetical protein M1827_000943 [Pycnora praestabilis]|nr:MAG: hypothetical protein M1827_000943 [Pycnora praestabilis]